MGVGHGSGPDAGAAGRTATRHALEGHDGEPRLLILFCADTYDLRALLAAVRHEAPGVPVIGCSTAGELSASASRDAGAGDAAVVVTALGGPGFEVATRHALVADGGLRDASFAAASCMDDVPDREHKILMILSDGLAGDQEEVVRGAYAAVGAAVPLVGGCAGDGLKMTRTFQLHGDDVLEGAVVAAAIASDGPFGIGVRHGWRRVGEPMVVTGSRENRVFTLDDKPALDTYFDRLDVPEEARTDPTLFTQFALTHPLGVSRRSGEEVRFVGGADFEERSLICIANVAQGGLAWVMEGDEQSVLDATDGACHEAISALAGRRPIGLVAFDCIARRGVMGDDGIQREIDRLAGFGDGAPVAGFYTYGEIARTKGTTGFHNQTLVVLAVA